MSLRARVPSAARGVVSVLAQELVRQGLIHEGATGEVTRGRRPTFLYIRTRGRPAVAVDVRFSKTFVMLSDFSGRQLALEIYDTVFALAHHAEGGKMIVLRVECLGPS